MKVRIKSKSWKTTVIGLIGLTVLASGLVLVYLKTITLTELAQSLGVIAIFLGSINSFFTKDSDVTGGTREQ